MLLFQLKHVYCQVKLKYELFRVYKIMRFVQPNYSDYKVLNGRGFKCSNSVISNVFK